MILKSAISEVVEHQFGFLERKSLGIQRTDLNQVKLYDSFHLQKTVKQSRLFRPGNI